MESIKNSKVIRHNNYDLLRIISTIAVILIHVNWKYFSLLSNTSHNSISWMCGNLLNIVTRFSVPSFVMISGAFILCNENNREFSFFYRKMFRKVIMPTLVVALMLFPLKVIIVGLKQRKYTVLMSDIVTGSYFNLWYIYMIAGLYLITPFLVRLKEVISWKEYKAMSYVMLVWGVVSQASSEEKLPYSIGVVFAFLGYYMVGDVLRRQSAGYRNIKHLAWKVVVCISCIGISFFTRLCGFKYYESEAFITFFSPSIVIYSLCIFSIFSNISINKDYSWLASKTFKIYLFHTAVLLMLNEVIKRMDLNLIVSEIVLLISTFLISLAIACGFDTVWNMLYKKQKYIGS